MPLSPLDQPSPLPVNRVFFHVKVSRLPLTFQGLTRVDSTGQHDKLLAGDRPDHTEVASHPNTLPGTWLEYGNGRTAARVVKAPGGTR